VSSTIDVERTNELIRLFGEHQYADMRVERREAMRSVLFDLPRRSPLGWQCLYEHGADFLREVSGHATPEEIGRLMRTVGSRPYALQPFIVVCSYLGARQQRMLDLGLRQGDPFPEERPWDLSFVMDWWARLQSSYRSDDALLPRQADGSLPILDEPLVRELSERTEPLGEERYTRVRRMAATLELFSFVLHGEQRDGIFGHGPYDPGVEGVLFCKEFNDLQNDYMPWANTEARIPVANVAVVHVAHDVRLTCDMFGSMTVEPHELSDHLERVAVLTNEGGRLRQIDEAEVEEIQHRAADAQEELFRTAVDWDDRYKIEYGSPLFANHLKPFFDVAGMNGDAAARLMDACQGTADRMVGELMKSEMPSIWKHMAEPEGDFYWPLVT
jgi:hypothetical protein